MLSRVGVLAITLAGCASDYAEDGAFLDGSGHSGALIRGRYFANTTCAANPAGELRCFSSCNPVVYGMGLDLSTIDRIDAPVSACDGSLDATGNLVAIVGSDNVAVTNVDGSFATIDALPITSSIGAPLSGRPSVAAGHLAMVNRVGTLMTYDADSGALLWRNDEQTFRAVAMQSDGSVIGAGNTSLVAFAPDGTIRWTQPIAARAIAVGLGDEIAVSQRMDVSKIDLQLLDAKGQLRWERSMITAQNVSVDIATDGSDIYVAAAGFFDPIVPSGEDGVLSRQSKDGTVWWTELVGNSPVARILAVTPVSLLVQLSVHPVSTDQDQYMPEDHATTGIGDAVLLTNGGGQLIANIAL